MAQGVDHPAYNFTFHAPPGEEERVGDLRVYVTLNPTGTQITSVTTCWELTDDEIAEIVRTRKVMMNCMGAGLMAHYITSPTHMREFVTDFGRTWDGQAD